MGWYEVPFCNLVIGRSLLSELGSLPTAIAWDVDDFDLCTRAMAAGARFRSRVDLRIVHDRYPDTVARWLVRKATQRYRTGEKLVRYPGTYLRVPGVVVGAVAPWLVVLVASGAARRGRRTRAVWCAVVPVYLSVALWDGHRRARSGPELARFVGGLVGLHVASIVGLQAGIVAGALARLAGRPDRSVPMPTEGPAGEGGQVGASARRAQRT